VNCVESHMQTDYARSPLVVARLCTRARIYEVGISYYGRTYDQEKKISWKDSVAAAYAIV
jgi:hypothetical protein